MFKQCTSIALYYMYRNHLVCPVAVWCGVKGIRLTSTTRRLVAKMSKFIHTTGARQSGQPTARAQPADNRASRRRERKLCGYGRPFLGSGPRNPGPACECDAPRRGVRPCGTRQTLVKVRLADIAIEAQDNTKFTPSL